MDTENGISRENRQSVWSDSGSDLEEDSRAAGTNVRGRKRADTVMEVVEGAAAGEAVEATQSTDAPAAQKKRQRKETSVITRVEIVAHAEGESDED